MLGNTLIFRIAVCISHILPDQQEDSMNQYCMLLLVMIGGQEIWEGLVYQIRHIRISFSIGIRVGMILLEKLKMKGVNVTGLRQSRLILFL